MNKEHVADAEDQSASALSKPLVRQKDGAIWSRERARKHEEQVKRAHEQDANRPKLPEIKPKGGRLLKKWKPNRSLSFRKQGAPVQQKPNFKPQKQAPTQQKKPLTNTKGAPTLPQGSTKPGTLERSELLDNSHRRLDGSKDYPQFREQGKFGSHSAYDAMDDESNP